MHASSVLCSSDIVDAAKGRETFDKGNSSELMLLDAKTAVGVFAKRKLVMAPAFKVAVIIRRRHCREKFIRINKAIGKRAKSQAALIKGELTFMQLHEKFEELLC